jgi:hypothetical protein
MAASTLATNGMPRRSGSWSFVCPGVSTLARWRAPIRLIKCKTLTQPLIGMERYEEARAFVVKYHANGDAAHPIVDLEMDEMRASMREQGILSWRNFF